MSAGENLSGRQFFHGSAHRFVRGSVITSANKAGVESNWSGVGNTTEHAHASTDLGAAAYYGHAAVSNSSDLHQKNPYIYRVEPVGEHEADPLDTSSVRSKEGFRVVDPVPKKTWSKALKTFESRPR